MTTTPASTPSAMDGPDHGDAGDLADDCAWYDFVLACVKPMLDDPALWRPCALAVHDEASVILLRMIARHNAELRATEIARYALQVTPPPLRCVS